jgi:NAD(P)H-hydrate epimerase
MPKFTPPFAPESIPLSREQVRQIDRLSLERYHIPGIVLMENAARAAAGVAWEMLGVGAGRVLILCGGGNNGGDGLAVARHLHNRGADVTIALTVDPAKYTGDAKINYDIALAMGLKIVKLDAGGSDAGGSGAGQRDPDRPAAGSSDPNASPNPDASLSTLGDADLVIDAIFGTGLDRPPRPPFEAIAATVNGWKRHVLAIDVPSGLDCDTGQPLGACIAATRTITFVAEKIGFGRPEALDYVGQVTVGDIGCPRELIENVRT